MQFISPAFLFALFALVIPILIHLFNFRRFRRIYFSNVRFLAELQQKTKKRSELKHLLILLSRILAITALVFAFARPYFPADGTTYDESSVKHVSIYVDNSFSMDAIGSRGLLLDVAKALAAEVAGAYRASDAFNLITNDFLGKHQQFVSRDEFLDMLNELSPSAASRKISDVYGRQSDIIAESRGGNNVVFMISDYQKNTADLSSLSSDTLFSVFHVPVVPVSYDNVYIDSCWFSMPYFRLGQQLRLSARIFNASDAEVTRMPVKLSVNGVQRAVASLDIEPWSYTDAELSYTAGETGVHEAVVEISDYPVTYDDFFYLSYTVNESSGVLVLYDSEPSQAFRALFANDSAFVISFMPLRSIDYSRLPENSLIILDGLRDISSGLSSELNRYLNAGGNLFIIPHESPEMQSYNRFLGSIEMPLLDGIDSSGSRVGYIDFQHSLFRDVFESDILRQTARDRLDLPKAGKYFRSALTARSKARIPLRLESDAPFLLHLDRENSNVYMLQVPLSSEFSNLSRHSLFVIMTYRIALLSDRMSQLYLVPGKYEEFFIPGGRLEGDRVYRLKGKDGNIEIIPAFRRTESGAAIGLEGQISIAGNYLLYAGDSLIAGIAVNYDRQESDLRSYTREEIKELLKSNGLKNHKIIDGLNRNISQSIIEMTATKFLWKWFLLLALLFLATEIAIIRLWK
jgi:hypothetical protein